MTFFSFWELIIRKIFKIVTLGLKNGPESIPNDSRIGPEPFRSNFHLIFGMRDTKTVDFQLKSMKKFKSMPEIWQDIDRQPSFYLVELHTVRRGTDRPVSTVCSDGEHST